MWITETSKQNKRIWTYFYTCNYMSGKVTATGERDSFISVWIKEESRQFLPQYKHFLSAQLQLQFFLEYIAVKWKGRLFAHNL